MGIKTYQEKNTRAMEKELAQSDKPVKRKVQKTIRKCQISPVSSDSPELAISPDSSELKDSPD